MKDLRFFDSNIMVGTVRVPFKGVEPGTAEIMSRLAECGIREGLAYHSSSVENHPSVGNRKIVDELTGFFGFFPVWAVLPFATNELGSPEELRSQMKSCGVKGVLFYPGSHGYINSEWYCGDLYAMLEGMWMPMFTRLSGEEDFNWDALHRLLCDHPRLAVILRNVHYHAGRVLYKMLDLHDNLFIEACDYKVFNDIEELVSNFGARRIIFGSAAPHMSPGAAVAQLVLCGVSDEEKALIAGDNLRNLIGRIDYDA